jgi:hypothetical protein
LFIGNSSCHTKEYGGRWPAGQMTVSTGME